MPYAPWLIFDPEPNAIIGGVDVVDDRLPCMAGKIGDLRHGGITYRDDVIARRNIRNAQPAVQVVSPVNIPRPRVASCDQQGKQ